MNKKLTIIGGRAALRGGCIYCNFSFGVIVNEFAKFYDIVYLSCPVSSMSFVNGECELCSNVVLCPQPDWKSTFQSLMVTKNIIESYEAAIKNSDHVFIRGNPVRKLNFLYNICNKYECKICHWIVGDSLKLLQAQSRNGFFKDFLSKLYMKNWEYQLKKLRLKNNSILLCNGRELAEKFTSPKTHAVVSTSLNESDFYFREDTCHGDEIAILTVCYVRPEKGIEYLLSALSLIESDTPIKLRIAGSRDRYPEYQNRLDALVEDLSLCHKVEWLGHQQRAQIFDLMKRADLFVLPTLSEGTPRVLVEARAASLPIVSTNVGGIPTSVENGVDGLLVAPYDEALLAKAITQIIKNGNLRRSLIRNGYANVQKMTVSSFVEFVMRRFEGTYR